MNNYSNTAVNAYFPYNPFALCPFDLQLNESVYHDKKEELYRHR